MSDQCEKSIIDSGRFFPRRCQKKATINEEGKQWCHYHAPSRVKARHTKQIPDWENVRKERADILLHLKREKAESIVRALKRHALASDSFKVEKIMELL